VAGKSVQGNARIESVFLAEFNHRELIFAKQKENLLGLTFLSRYIVTFDFPSGRLYLKKGKRFDDCDVQDKSGVHVVRGAERPIVESVDSGSPAALAGVHAGDEIIRLSDRDTERLSLFSLRKLLCRPGKEARLTIRRSGQEIVCPIVLSK
jgi:hypothetical protein